MPTMDVTIKFRGKKRRIGTWFLLRNSRLARRHFQNNTAETVIVVPDDEPGITHETLCAMIEFFETGEYHMDGAEDKYVGGWMSNLFFSLTAEKLYLRRPGLEYGPEKRDKVLRELPNYFLTARYFESASMEKMLKTVAGDSFTRAMCYKGSRPGTAHFVAYTKIITEALETAFHPASWPNFLPRQRTFQPYGEEDLYPQDDISDHHAGRIMEKIGRDTTRPMWEILASTIEHTLWGMDVEDTVRDMVEDAIDVVTDEVAQDVWDGLLDEVVLAVDGPETAEEKEKVEAIYLAARSVPCKASTDQGSSSPWIANAREVVAKDTHTVKDETVETIVEEVVEGIIHHVESELENANPLKRKAQDITADKTDKGEDAAPAPKRVRFPKTVRPQGTNGEETTQPASASHPTPVVVDNRFSPLPDVDTPWYCGIVPWPYRWQSAHLHPALDPLRQAYAESLYHHRIDLLQNTSVLTTLSHLPHLSAAFLRYAAGRGGTGVQWILPTGGLRVGVMLVLPAWHSPLRGVGEFVDCRHWCLNCPEWMEWVSEDDFVMAAFWMEMALRGGMGYLRERKERVMAKMAPF